LSLPGTGPCSCLRVGLESSPRVASSPAVDLRPLDAPALSALYTMDPMHSSLGTVGPAQTTYVACSTAKATIFIYQQRLLPEPHWSRRGIADDTGL
jgi:hypothetical protein